MITTVTLSQYRNAMISGCADGTITVWNLDISSDIDTWKGHDETVLSLSLSSDESRLISSSRNTIKIWELDKNLNKAKEIMVLGMPYPSSISAWSDNGNVIAFQSSENAITIVDPDSKMKPKPEVYV